MKSKKWTTSNIPDLSGKLIIVTGGNSGLGYESVKAFADKGAKVVLASRSVEKGEAAKKKILAQITNGTITVMQLDLMDFSSIKNFVSKFKEQYKRLDILMNNAGIMTVPYGLTKDGYESQIGTNHLGHFLLTGLLIELIINTHESRVVNVSSSAHKYGKMDFRNLLFKNGKDYSPMKAYARSKLANLLFTYELQRLFKAKNINSIALAAHPGFSHTNLGRHLESKLWYRLLRPLIELIPQSAAMGSLPQIRAAVDPLVKGGEYYGPGGFTEMSGHPVLVKSNRTSHNREDAKKLWELSEELTGISYKI